MLMNRHCRSWDDGGMAHRPRMDEITTVESFWIFCLIWKFLQLIEMMMNHFSDGEIIHVWWSSQSILMKVCSEWCSKTGPWWSDESTGDCVTDNATQKIVRWWRWWWCRYRFQLQLIHGDFMCTKIRKWRIVRCRWWCELFRELLFDVWFGIFKRPPKVAWWRSYASVVVS